MDASEISSANAGVNLFSSCTEMEEKGCVVRAEIDTSAPFESVKEAATRFGGIGFWKPTLHKSFEVEAQLISHKEKILSLWGDVLLCSFSAFQELLPRAFASLLYL